MAPAIVRAEARQLMMVAIVDLARASGTIGRPMTPTGACGDAITALAEMLGPAHTPEDFDEILGVRCSSL